MIDVMVRSAPQRAVRRAIARHSFCTLATSTKDRPHVVGVLYVAIDDRLYVCTEADTKKARNIAANANVSVCIPVKSLPFVPPFVVQFVGTAEIFRPDDPEIAGLLAARLKKITSHGELEHGDACFLRITPSPKVHTYGVGVSLLSLARAPLDGARTVDLR